MINPTWQTPDGAAQLYLGDCLDIMPGLGKVDAVVINALTLTTSSSTIDGGGMNYEKSTGRQ